MLYESAIQKANLIMTLRSMGISSDKVLSAIEHIPREIFLPSNFSFICVSKQPFTNWI